MINDFAQSWGNVSERDANIHIISCKTYNPWRELPNITCYCSH